MADSGWLSNTGREGSILLDSGFKVNAFAVISVVTSITSPRVRVLTSNYPRRLQYAGSLQLLTDDNDLSNVTQNVPWLNLALNWEMEEHRFVATGASIPASIAVAWTLPPGVDVSFKVYW